MYERRGCTRVREPLTEGIPMASTHGSKQPSRTHTREPASLELAQAELCMRTNNTKDAIKHFESARKICVSALKESPEPQPWANIDLGAAYCGLATLGVDTQINLLSAEKSYREAIRLHPEDADAKDGLALVAKRRAGNPGWVRDVDAVARKIERGGTMLGDWKHKEIEPKWQAKWVELGAHAFHPEDNTRPVFSIDTPPPFTSGKIHMGHVLSYAYLDIIARYKRLRGFNVYYPQGWDCMGFPTETKVEKLYGRLPREEFVQKCIEFSTENIEIMRKQMNSIGFSPDWKYEYATLNPSYKRLVQLSLIKMFDKGLVYRGEHPIYWCPHCVSAIAKSETEEQEKDTKLNFLKFASKATPEGTVTIATTRPEMLHACAAVLVHPDDERFTKLVGTELVVPIFGQKVKVIADKEVDPKFGTGIVMVCTFGDIQDVTWSYRHKLAVIPALDEFGKLVNAGEFTGIKAAQAREKILERLSADGVVVKQEPLHQAVKVHDRCKKQVELINSKQWFYKTVGREDEIRKAADTMKWSPKSSRQYLDNWLEHVEWDWVISRNRFFGTPMPFWNCGNTACDYSVAADPKSLPIDPAKSKPPADCCPKCKTGKLVPENTVADVWVDSSISPLVIAKWEDDPAFFAKTYPATLRSEGIDIIKVWGYCTIIRDLDLTGVPPFTEVLNNGMVLAPDGKKMSKSLGNEIKPEVIVDEYSADAARQWAALFGVESTYKPFIEKDIKYAKSFIIKLWNASKFVEKFIEDFDPGADASRIELRAVDKQMLSRVNALTALNAERYDNYEYFPIITSIHEFFWHEFCDYYLEEAKHRLYKPDIFGEESKIAAQYTMYHVLLDTLKMLSPISPHVTEEIYDVLFKKHEKDLSLSQSHWPVSTKEFDDPQADKAVELLTAVLGEIRKFKAANQLSLNEELSRVKITTPDPGLAELVRQEIVHTGKIKQVDVTAGELSVAPER